MSTLLDIITQDAACIELAYEHKNTGYDVFTEYTQQVTYLSDELADDTLTVTQRLQVMLEAWNKLTA